MGIDRTPFSDRAFGILDEDDSGELDFHEFIAGLWLIGSANKHHLCRFAFDIFDEDGGGSLDEAEIDAMFRMMHNVEVLPDEVQIAYNHIIEDTRRKKGLTTVSDITESENTFHKEEKYATKGIENKEQKMIEDNAASYDAGKLAKTAIDREEENAIRDRQMIKEMEEKRRLKQTFENKKLEAALLEIEKTILDEGGPRVRRRKKRSNNDNLFADIGIKVANSDEESEESDDMTILKGNGAETKEENLLQSKVDLNKLGIETYEEEEEIEVTLSEMYEYVDLFPEILEPIVNLQKLIRKKCLGARYWRNAMKRRVKMFGDENMDKILFEKKRQRAKKDKMQKEKRERRKIQRLKEIEDEKKRKAEEEFQKRVEFKLTHCTQNEKNYREASKAVERAKLTLKEAEELGKAEGIENVEQCARLRQRLQRAIGEQEAMWQELEKEWDEQKTKELEKERKKAEEQAIAELMGPGGPKMVRESAKKMRWVFKLMPRVDDSLQPLAEVTYQQCKERVKKEYIVDAMVEAENLVEQKYAQIREEEKKFVQDVILENPWDVAQDPNKKKEEEPDFLDIVPTEPFLNEEDWILHLSVEGTYFQSSDIVMWQQIQKEVPKRILRMAGITPILKYKRLTAEEKKQLQEEEKKKKILSLAKKNQVEMDFKL